MDLPCHRLLNAVSKDAGADAVEIAACCHQYLKSQGPDDEDGENQHASIAGRQSQFQPTPHKRQALQEREHRQASPLFSTGGGDQADGQKNHAEGGALAEAGEEIGAEVDGQQFPLLPRKTADGLCRWLV